MQRPYCIAFDRESNSFSKLFFRNIMIAGVIDPDEEDRHLKLFKRIYFSLKTGLISIWFLSSIKNFELNTDLF